MSSVAIGQVKQINQNKIYTLLWLPISHFNVWFYLTFVFQCLENICIKKFRVFFPLNKRIERKVPVCKKYDKQRNGLMPDYN